MYKATSIEMDGLTITRAKHSNAPLVLCATIVICAVIFLFYTMVQNPPGRKVEITQIQKNGTCTVYLYNSNGNVIIHQERED